MEKYWKVIVLCKKHSRISCYGKGATTHCSHQTKGLLGLEHFSHHLYLFKWASVSKSFLKLIYLNNYMYYPKNKCYQLETHPSSIPFSQVIVSQLVSKSPLYIRFLGPSSRVSGPAPGIACLQPLRVSNSPVVALSHTPRRGRIFWGEKIDGGTLPYDSFPL